MDCPKCKSTSKVKDGIVKGKQRYKCSACDYRFSVEHKHNIQPYFRRLALMLYLEGLGLRSIGRLIGVSNVTVLNWIKSYGLKAQNHKPENSQVDIIEMDEVHTFIGSKKTSAGYGWLLIGWGKDGWTSCVATAQAKRV